ncbi:hypothetical protein BGZ49_006651, partial [Haplosporangium sp. Z 27]
TISDLIHLRKLRHLHLNFLSVDVPRLQVLFFPVLDFAEIFSKVASLKPVLPARTHELSMVDVADTEPWTATAFDVEPEAIPLASKFQGLKEVVISSDHDSFPVSLKLLLGCAALRVNVSLGSLADHIDVITQLRQLTSLDVVVGSLSKIEFLMSNGSGMDLSPTA